MNFFVKKNPQESVTASLIVQQCNCRWLCNLKVSEVGYNKELCLHLGVWQILQQKRPKEDRTFWQFVSNIYSLFILGNFKVILYFCHPHRNWYNFFEGKCLRKVNISKGPDFFLTGQIFTPDWPKNFVESRKHWERERSARSGSMAGFNLANVFSSFYVSGSAARNQIKHLLGFTYFRLWISIRGEGFYFIVAFLIHQRALLPFQYNGCEEKKSMPSFLFYIPHPLPAKAIQRYTAPDFPFCLLNMYIGPTSSILKHQLSFQY